MASVTSSRGRNAAQLRPTADVARLLAETGDPVPVLVARVPELERAAWRSGLRAARRLERVAGAAFRSAVATALRAGDALAHDAGSDLFVAVLFEPDRARGRFPEPIDTRSALARIAARVESATALRVEAGWTVYEPASDAHALESLCSRALARGAQERERYAFFATIGHEVKTPLASIRGYLETLRDGDLTEEQRGNFVSTAFAEAVRLTRLVDGMFELSLLDLDGASSAGEGNAAEALRAAHAACSAAAAHHDVTLDVRCPAMTVAIATDRLVLVAVNLIENAIKHGPRGGTVRVAGRRVRGALVLHVDDRGPGIPPALRERVFALRARGLTHGAGRGSGIGLALVRLIVERAGGRIAVGTAPGGGCRFSVTLPAPARSRSAG